jgi:hypothetical protein
MINKKGKTVNRMKQYQAMLDLAGGMGVNEVAEKHEILPTTVHRWLRDPGFDAMYNDAQQKIFMAGIDVLVKSVGKAAMRVIGVLDDPHTDNLTRLRAADLIFKYTSLVTTAGNEDNMIRHLTARGYTISVDAESMVKQLQSKGVPVAMIEAGDTTSEKDAILDAITIIETDMLNL